MSNYQTREYFDLCKKTADQVILEIEKSLKNSTSSNVKFLSDVLELIPARFQYHIEKNKL